MSSNGEVLLCVPYACIRAGSLVLVWKAAGRADVKFMHQCWRKVHIGRNSY